jgi:hypothetical protein
MNILTKRFTATSFVVIEAWKQPGCPPATAQLNCGLVIYGGTFINSCLPREGMY